MFIGLYTSRVILKGLGFDDYGIYNVVGGFVALFSVICNSLSGAASRFLNFELGKGNIKGTKAVFSTTLTIHIILAITIIILAEIFGTWFLNNKMIIPNDRLTAANWCFQLSLLTFCSTLITVPYNAAIIAHERMKAFAYVSLLEGIAKLVIAILITYSTFDKLILYAILICILQISVATIYRIYCKRNFQECIYSFIYDKKLLKDIFSYSGWGFIGTTSTLLRNQGGDVIINLFFGPTINAARSIANQIMNVLNGFVTNFMTAIRPQITQSYANGEIDYLIKLIYNSTKYSFYLFAFISLPILMTTEYLLKIWLGDIPDHTVTFVQLTLIFALLDTLSHPSGIAQAATGKIRNYQLVVSGLQLLNLPISYIFLKLGNIPETILIISIIIEIVCIYARTYMLAKLVPIDIVYFIKHIIFKTLIVFITALILPLIGKNLIHIDNIGSFIILIIISLLSTTISILIIGCNKEERSFIFNKTATLLNIRQ